MGKGSAPQPIDPGQSQGEYLFGKSFEQYQGVTDPILQQRLLGAEAAGRPQYTALELQDINTMLMGSEDVVAGPNPAYEQLTSSIREQEAGLQGLRGEELTQASSQVDYLKQELARTSPTIDAAEGAPGLLQQLENVSQSSFGIQQNQLAQQREADVQALRDYAPQAVEAYRTADPHSTNLAQAASQEAIRARSLARGFEGQGGTYNEWLLGEKGRGNLGYTRDASQGENMLGQQAGGMFGAQGQAITGEQSLGQVGQSLMTTTPEAGEALLGQRGLELSQSTGQLSPLAARRSQQAARLRGVSSGRLRDQSSLYDEMTSRASEELNKRGQDISLGSQLLGQQSALRGARLGQGSALLGQQAAIRGQRIGQASGLLGQQEAFRAQRFGEQQQTQQQGAGMMGQSSAQAAQRRAMNLQEQSMLEARASQAGQQAFGMNRALAGDLGMTILGRPSSAIGLGQQTLGQAQAGAAQPVGPQLFDPNAGINLALGNQANQSSYSSAQAGAQGAMVGGGMAAAGALGGAAIIAI